MSAIFIYVFNEKILQGIFADFSQKIFRAGLRRKKCKHPIKYRYVTRTNFWAKK
jgi:hypothetical protein